MKEENRKGDGFDLISPSRDRPFFPSAMSLIQALFPQDFPIERVAGRVKDFG
jgi:hypothetical protein